MPTLSSNPSTVVSAGTWTTPANVYASDNVYATNVGTTQNTEYPFEVGGFTFASAPTDGTSLTSVDVIVEAKTTTAARAQIKVELLDGTTVLGTLALTNLTAADVNYTLSTTATRAQLDSPNLKVRVTNKRTASQASTTSVDWVKIDAVYAFPPTKAETFVDDFSTGIDTAVWNATAATASAGAVALAVTSGGYPAVTTENKKTLSLRGSSIYMQWVTVPALGASNEIFFEMIANTNNSVSAFRSGSSTGITLRTRVGGTNTQVAGTTTNGWWRLREAGGSVYLDTSPDGVAWTQLLTKAHTLSAALLDAMYVNITAGDYGALGAKTVVIDNVNTTGAPAVADGRPKVWTGSAWAKKPVKVWTGAAWVEKPMKVWTGSTWKVL
jgi:hypothetical protein